MEGYDVVEDLVGEFEGEGGPDLGHGGSGLGSDSFVAVVVVVFARAALLVAILIPLLSTLLLCL